MVARRWYRLAGAVDTPEGRWVLFNTSALITAMDAGDGRAVAIVNMFFEFARCGCRMQERIALADLIQDFRGRQGAVALQ
jgi:hypothetical protein